jgi:LuxR family quorum-sensing transcriptional regulator LasR
MTLAFQQRTPRPDIISTERAAGIAAYALGYMKTIGNLSELFLLLECKHSDEWSEMLFKLAKHYGFPYVFFGIKQSKTATCKAAFIESNFSSAWLKTYAEQFYDIDPIASHCRHHAHPLVWDADTFVTERQHQFYEDGCQYGLHSGIGYPIHGPEGQAGLLCLASSEESAVSVGMDTQTRASMALLRDYACESHLKMTRIDKVWQSTTVLTPRELECLKWVTAGKTSWEMSRILSCSEATINFHISNVTKKFGVQTRRQAAIRAIGEGLVDPG